MTKKCFLLQVSCIILLMLFFLLSSCSQAVSTSQDQTKYDAKISSGTTEKSLRQDGTRFYHAIPTIMEDHPGWDWCASAAICMMFLDPNCSWVDQSDLYKFKQYPDYTFAGYNARYCIDNYKNFHGYSAYVSAGYSAPNLKFLAQYGFNYGHLFIDVRKNFSNGSEFTVVMYGYDLTNNQIAYWNPNTGFCGWVDYGKFLSNLNEGGVQSYSSWMTGVIYDPYYIKY
jgi:hypothetical protein